MAAYETSGPGYRAPNKMGALIRATILNLSNNARPQLIGRRRNAPLAPTRRLRPSPSFFRQDALPPWFADGNRQDRGENVCACRDPEDHVPTPGRLLDRVGIRDQQRRRSLGGIEQARIWGSELRPEGVSAGRWEQAVDFSPGEEYQSAEDHEPQRVGAK